MVAFPWLITIILLVILAQLILIASGTFGDSLRARRLRRHRPTRRAIAVLAVVELVLLLVWGLVLRPR